MDYFVSPDVLTAWQMVSTCNLAEYTELVRSSLPSLSTLFRAIRCDVTPSPLLPSVRAEMMFSFVCWDRARPISRYNWIRSRGQISHQITKLSITYWQKPFPKLLFRNHRNNQSHNRRFKVFQLTKHLVLIFQIGTGEPWTLGISSLGIHTPASKIRHDRRTPLICLYKT